MHNPTTGSRHPTRPDAAEAKQADAIHAPVLELVAALDRDYFDRRPDRATYVRSAVAHELCVPGERCRDLAGRVILVAQLAPGVRARRVA